MQLISQGETYKETLTELIVGLRKIEEKDKFIKNSDVMF